MLFNVCIALRDENLGRFHALAVRILARYLSDPLRTSQSLRRMKGGSVEMTGRTFEINIEDHMGFLRVFMGRGEPAGELAQFLSGTLAQWIQNNPDKRIVAVVPVTRYGDTVELHAFHEKR